MSSSKVRAIVLASTWVVGCSSDPSDRAGPGSALSPEPSPPSADGPTAELRGETGLGPGERLLTHDLIWRHADGTNAVWHMVGPEIHDVANLPSVGDPNWKLQAMGDFDGDGRTDFLWRHLITNETAFWFMDGEKIRGIASLEPRVDASWQVAAAADFDGDGRPDLFWRNVVTGANGIWLMNGTRLREVVPITTIADLRWKLRGAGDFDGDGRADLVWRHDDGTNGIWFLGARGAIARVGSVASAGPTWSIDAVADVDTDGIADLVWRDSVSGQIGVWFMNGERIASAAVLDPPVADRAWQIVGARKRLLSGFSVAARGGTPSHDRGIRRWVVVPGARGARTHFVAVDGRGPRFYTSGVVPAEGADDPALTTDQTIARYGIRPLITTRFTATSHADREVLLTDMKNDLAGPIPSPRGDGGPSLNSWDNCDQQFWVAYGALLGVSVAVGKCVATLAACAPTSPWALLCMGSVGTAACAGAPGALCAANGAMGAMHCCMGGDMSRWPVRTSCFPTTTPPRCSCAEKYPGSHLEYRKREWNNGFAALFGEYRCATSSYKILVERDRTTADVWGFGGFCRGLPGAGSYTWQSKRSYQEIDLGNWDAEPVIEPGVEDRGPQCGATGAVTPGSASGTRAGVSVMISTGFYRSSRVSWSNANGEGGAARTEARIVCKGWDWGPDSEYRTCADQIRAARGGTFDEQILADPRCVPSPCDSVGW
jgi:hypothetical protein